MDLRWNPLPVDAPRTTSVLLYAAAVVPASIVQDLVAPIRDLTPLVSRVRQTESDLTVTLVWHDELFGANMPAPGQWIAARLNGTLLCVMLLESVNDYRMRSGERSMTLVARSRDATSAWRDDPISTVRYPQGTHLNVIAENTAVQLGMDAIEVDFPVTNYGTPQTWFQATNVSAWQLIEQCLVVQGYQPFVDAIGRLRAYSRDVLRASDVAVSDERVMGFNGAKARTPIDQFSVKWRAPMPVKVSQEERVLGSASITGGFWKPSTDREIYWSEDRTQQADLDPALTPDDYRDTRDSPLFVRHSINGGIVRVADQFFIPIYAERPDGTRGGCIGGRILCNMTHYRDDIITNLIGAKLLKAVIPDGVNVAAGQTISAGRLVSAALDMTILTLMCTVGAGHYEVKGRPYDLANPVNETLAYDPEGSTGGRQDTLETDLIDDETRARAVATREFIYRARAASNFALTIVDDPRIEVGDIVEMDDGTRILVTGIQRDLSHGSSNVVELSGFPA